MAKQKRQRLNLTPYQQHAGLLFVAAVFFGMGVGGLFGDLSDGFIAGIGLGFFGMYWAQIK